jgi:Activator of Hsp90 ATPase homolog 1-like protein
LGLQDHAPGPPRLLSYTFDPAGPESEVTFELEPRGKDVLLVIIHRRIADRKTMVNVASGWDTHVGILGDRLNGVEPRPFWTTHATLKREYEARL